LDGEEIIKMTELDSSYNMTTANNNFINGSALQIRLDTATIIENVEMFLGGSRLVVERDDTTGKISTRKVSLGTPKANSEGIQAILNWLQLTLNPQNVQGNFPTDKGGLSSKYDEFVFWCRVDLCSNMVKNIYKWHIKEDDIDIIVDSLMNAVEPFFTRLIGNKERESYLNTLQHVEHSRMNNDDSEKVGFFG